MGAFFNTFEHSAIILTFIMLPFVIQIFVLSIFEWPLKTGSTVRSLCDFNHICTMCTLKFICKNTFFQSDVEPDIMYPQTRQ